MKRVEVVRAARERIAEAAALRAMATVTAHARAMSAAENEAVLSLLRYRDALLEDNDSACHIAEFSRDVVLWRQRLLAIDAGMAQNALDAARDEWTKTRLQTEQTATLLRSAQLEMANATDRREQMLSDERFLSRRFSAASRGM